MGVSFDKIDGVIWYDGKLVAWADANVHILTHGLHYASCVFEGERAYGGTIYKGTEHSERLKRSAITLGLNGYRDGDTTITISAPATNRPATVVGWWSP